MMEEYDRCIKPTDGAVKMAIDEPAWTDYAFFVLLDGGYICIVILG
jgi:hypothetical protein